MGFSNTGTTVQLTAKLTPYGRRKLAEGTPNLINGFSIGDSDANYLVEDPLSGGEVPVSSGNLGESDSFNNSVYENYKSRSSILLNTNGSLIKTIPSDKNRVSVETEFIGYKNLSSSGLTNNVLDRTDVTDSLSNLFYSFGLPITDSDKEIFDSLPYSKGGFSDNALSGINQDNIIIIGIDKSQYGEVIDGKNVRIDITFNGNNYLLYSTFQKRTVSDNNQDSKFRESNSKINFIGNNIVYLFSDQIQRPNSDLSKSWATGYGLKRPYVTGKKEYFNLQTSTNVGLNADNAVGFIHLDKGFIVITDPTIVGDYNTGDENNTTVTFTSVVSNVVRKVTCVLDVGEFRSTRNKTYNDGRLRISEINLHDNTGQIVAVAKTNGHLLKGLNQVLVLGVTIVV